jgi:hypothetical protein
MAKSSKIPSESQEQQRLVLKLRWLYPDIIFFAIPNGGKRNRAEAVRMKLEGLEKGTPDIFIAAPRGNYHGLFIELKKKVRSKISDAQNKKIKELTALKYACFVCFGADEALKVINTYLEG